MEQKIHLKSELDKLAVFKYILLVGVIGIHASFVGDYRAGTLPEIGASAIEWFVTFVLQLSVPGFFIISGFLFFRDGYPTPAEYKRKFISRVQTLVIPYFLWCSFALLIVFLKKTPMLEPYFPQYDDWMPDFYNVIKGYLVFQDNYPYDFVLWFVRNLILIVLLTPVIGAIFKKAGRWVLILFLAIPFLPIPWMLGPSFAFFCFGAWLSLFFGNITSFIKRYGIFFFCSWVVLIVLNTHLNSGIVEYIYFFILLSGSIALLWILDKSWCLISRIPKSIYSTAFFIYAFHGLFISVLRKSITAIIPPASSAIEVVDFLLVIIAALAICTTIALLFKKIWRKAYDVLSGKR